MDGPALRVSYNRIALAMLDRLAKGATIRAELPVESIRAIEDGFRFAWLPIEHHMVLIEAVRKHLGDRAAYDFWRRVTLENFGGKAFQIPLSAIRRLFGLSPAAMCAQSARYWPQYARELGTMKLGAKGPGYATLELEGFPKDLLASGTWVIGMAGGLAAYFDVCKVDGVCEPLVLDADRGRVDFKLRWHERE
ncbi:MAG TPA: hypothetical protein VG755_27215 [Nannocystaceae bacterium]|nr:hypothetical protein [Nannocystaceae bacterium]